MKRAMILLLSLCVVFSLFTCSAFAEGYSADSVDQAIRDAESGNGAAMAYLGNLYYLGNYKQNVTRDFNKALEWFLKAADAGAADKEVLFNIARIYERGAAGEKDLEAAFEWYSKAAAAGSSEAQTAIEDEMYKTIRWKANSASLKGQLGEREMIGSGYAMPFYLDAPVENCDMISMDLRIVEVKNGWPYGGYALWTLGLNDKWTEAARFQIEKFQQDGEPRNYEFNLDNPISFKAIAVCLSEDGMEFGLVHEALFFVESSKVTAYSEAIPKPSFTPAAEEYPELSSQVSFSAYANPYG